MKNLILTFILLSSPLSLLAQDNLTSGLKKVANKKYFSFLSAELRPYALPYTVAAQRKTITSSQMPTLGSSIGFGREFRLTNRFSTSSIASAYFTQRFQNKTTLASETIDLELGEYNRNSSLFGAEFAQTINYNFYTRHYILQPTLQFGVSYGRAENSLVYNFDDRTDSESYELDVNDTFLSQRLGLGLNVMNASTDLYSFFMVSYVNYTNIERKFNGFQTISGGAPQSMDQFVMEKTNSGMINYSLGFGYRF